jgi:hypothetical protein
MRKATRYLLYALAIAWLVVTPVPTPPAQWHEWIRLTWVAAWAVVPAGALYLLTTSFED